MIFSSCRLRQTCAWPSDRNGGSICQNRLATPKKTVAEFCRKHHIRKLAFFGSVLRDDFAPGSDVDVLVEFEPGHTPGLEFFGMEAELSEISERRVDLNTPQFLSRHFGNQALAEAEVQYAAW